MGMTLKISAIARKEQVRGCMMQVARTASTDSLFRGLTAAVLPSLVAWAMILLLARALF